MIGLTTRDGDKTAVYGLSFVVEPGVVTGFLGPNGAGKLTTMRVIAGLDRPTSGTVRVNGKRYPGCAAPMSELGSSASSPPSSPNNPAATPPPRSGRSSPAASKKFSPASPRGLSNSEIAADLHLSEGTVKIHVGRIRYI